MTVKQLFNLLHRSHCCISIGKLAWINTACNKQCQRMHQTTAELGNAQCCSE